MKRLEFDYLKFKNVDLSTNASEVYHSFIDFCKSKLENIIYTERHHIIPKCLGGTDDDDNIVILSYPEHCFAHYLLALMYPNNKGLISAFSIMKCQNMNDFKNLEELRKLNSEKMKETNYKYFDDFYERKVKSGRYKLYNITIDGENFMFTRKQIKEHFISRNITSFKRIDIKNAKKLRSIKQFINHIDRFCNSNNQIFIETL